MSRVLTALQPTNAFHIGNYFGAIEPFLDLQKSGNESFLFVVDYHAITVPQDPQTLRKNILFATAVYLACGVDPSKTVLFQQSHVQEHTELAWILNCIAHMGELERMTQFKDKSKMVAHGFSRGEGISVGLFDYPVLMAADILLYDTEIVPIGEDQKQHVELARDLAERFNKRFGETFVIPKPVIRKQGARIMGLDDPEKKMSKSAPSAKNYISLMDDEATVIKKISSAVTDSESTIVFDEKRKGLANLITIYSLVTDTSVKNIETMFKNKGYGDFKKTLAKKLTDFLKPLQTKTQKFLEDETALQTILKTGATKARAIAQKKMLDVRKKIGVN